MANLSHASCKSNRACSANVCLSKETNMASQSRVTTDHEQIRQWAEERGGHPATVKRTEQGGEPGILRIDFPGFSGEDTLEEISWEDFFQKFEESGLAFLFQDKGESRFNKLVSRANAQAAGNDGGRKRSRSSSTQARSRSTASRGSRSSSRSAG